MQELAGRVAVVTGGASGIGKAMAARFAAAGMHVVIADVEEGPLGATADELGVVAVRTDVSDAASVQALADEVVARFGTAHVLCNNAGVGGGGRISTLTLNDWKWVLDVNLWGVVHGLHSFLPLLLANDEGGHVVNTASMAGLSAWPGIGPYNASKYAVVAAGTRPASRAASRTRVGDDSRSTSCRNACSCSPSRIWSDRNRACSKEPAARLLLMMRSPRRPAR